MKSLFGKEIREWFGYNRRERRASFILLILIGLVAGVRFIVPDSEADIEVLTSFQGGEIAGVPADSVLTYRNPAKRPEYHRTEVKKILELNTCDSAALESLPGLGPVLSARIIKYRNLLGGFAYVEQLREVYGLPAETYEMISTRLRADSLLVKRIDINKADFRQLIRLPYLDRAEVNSLLKYREARGRIGSLSELIDNKLIADGKVRKIRAYLEFGD